MARNYREVLTQLSRDIATVNHTPYFFFLQPLYYKLIMNANNMQEAARSWHS